MKQIRDFFCNRNVAYPVTDKHAKPDQSSPNNQLRFIVFVCFCTRRYLPNGFVFCMSTAKMSVPSSSIYVRHMDISRTFFFHYHEVMPNVWLMGDKWMGEGNVMAVLFRLFKSQKVAYSIPDLVFANITDIILPNTTALGSTHPLRERRTRNTSRGGG